MKNTAGSYVNLLIICQMKNKAVKIYESERSRRREFRAACLYAKVNSWFRKINRIYMTLFYALAAFCLGSALATRRFGYVILALGCLLIAYSAKMDERNERKKD